VFVVTANRMWFGKSRLSEITASHRTVQVRRSPCRACAPSMACGLQRLQQASSRSHFSDCCSLETIVSRSHYSFSPLKPSPDYPVNPALMKFYPAYRGRSIYLPAEVWKALGVFFDQMAWDVEWTTCAMPRLWIEQAHARGRLEKRLALDDARTVVQYEWKSPYEPWPDNYMLLSRGLCVGVANSIASGSMEHQTPQLYAALAPSLVEWRECGGLSGMYMAD